MSKIKIIRTSTVPVSLEVLLKGQLKFLNQYYDIIGVSSKGKELENVTNMEGISTIPIEISRKIDIIKDFKSLWNLYVLLKKEKPFIIHSITPKAGLLTMIAGKMAKIPIRMHTYTGLIFPSKSGLYKILLIYMDRLLCYCATNIYPEGQGVKNDLLKHKITHKPLNIIANGNVNGINTSFFNPDLFNESVKLELKNKLKIDNKDFTFCFIGRLVKDKGINELVSVFKELNFIYPQTKLLLVGNTEKDLDPLELEIETEIKNNPNIIAVGYQSDVRPYLSISDLFVFPSYREGFPNALMQAGAMGLSSIVTNINGSNEIIIDGVNGIIIPPKNKESLFLNMKLLLTDNTFREQLMSKARHLIISRYEQEIVWNAILKEYQCLEKKNNHV